MIQLVATWLACYLLSGIVLCTITLFATHGLDKANWQSIGAGDMLKDRPVVLLALILWPVIVISGIYAKLQPDGIPKEYFRCERKHLMRRVTIAEAEAAAVATDPLRRVPDLPFGHLNTGWKEFVAQLRQFDQLWEFAIPGQAQRSTSALMPQWEVPPGAKRGYAIVHLWKVKAEFLYEWD